jgi:glycoprotein endo-alpha-1,2-mannosidase
VPWSNLAAGSARIAASVRLALATLALLFLAPAAARAAGESSVFYYPWWGTPSQDGKYLHWNQRGHAPPADLATTYYPARGVYSSVDSRVLREQMREIKAAGVAEVISSWWGWGSPEDVRLPAVMRAAKRQGLEVAVQVEPYEKWVRTAAVLEDDLAHLRDAGIRRVYIYQPFDGVIGDAAWTTLLSEFSDLELLAQTSDVDRAESLGFDGVYTYDVLAVRGASFRSLCMRAHAAGLECAPSVGPGYNAERSTGDQRIRSRRQGKTYDEMWRAAIAARPDRVTITSYNEWHEGTQIEPARKHPAAEFQSYRSYEGAYGRFGRAAQGAYLERTGYWTNVYRIVAAVGRALDALLGVSTSP